MNLKVTGERVDQYRPVPSDFKRLEELVCQAEEDLLLVTDQLAPGLDDLDPAAIEAAVGSLYRVRDRINEANLKLPGLILLDLPGHNDLALGDKATGVAATLENGAHAREALRCRFAVS